MSNFSNINLALEQAVQSPQKIIEGKLGVQGLDVLSAFEIARLGAAVFANTEVAYQVANPSNLTPERQRLLGDKDIEFGAAGRALANAENILDSQELETLKRELAKALVYAYGIDKSIIPAPGVRVIYPTGVISLDTNINIQLPFLPRISIEYGPGITAARKMLHEVQYAEQTIMVEKSVYVNQFLTTLAAELGYMPGNSMKWIGREDGISGTITELKTLGLKEFADLVIASQIQYMDPQELALGITGSYQLLRRGGYLAIRANDLPPISTLTASEMMHLATQVFASTPIRYHAIQTFSQKHSIRGTGAVALFQKT